MLYFCLKRKSMKHFGAVNLKLVAIECFVKTGTNSIGELFYVSEDIHCRILNAEDYLKCFEVILLEFSLRNKKWLCFGLYKPPDQNEVLDFNLSMHNF